MEATARLDRPSNEKESAAILEVSLQRLSESLSLLVAAFCIFEKTSKYVTVQPVVNAKRLCLKRGGDCSTRKML